MSALWQKIAAAELCKVPAWLCECAAVLFALPVTHCVDDMIGVEPTVIAMTGNIAFKLLCEATGWAISAEKSPLPATNFIVIGVELDLDGVPEREAAIKVTKKRISQLKKTLAAIEASKTLGSGEAAALTGALGFTLCATFGRIGRAKLRPYIRRSGEWRCGLNTQI